MCLVTLSDEPCRQTFPEFKVFFSFYMETDNITGVTSLQARRELGSSYTETIG